MKLTWKKHKVRVVGSYQKNKRSNTERERGNWNVCKLIIQGKQLFLK